MHRNGNGGVTGVDTLWLPYRRGRRAPALAGNSGRDRDCGRNPGDRHAMQELVRLTNQYGLLLIFGAVLFESLGLPLPAMPLLIVAGALAGNGAVSLGAVAGVALLGVLIGDVAWYFAGRRFGNRVLKTLCRISLSPDSCVRQTETLYERWGGRMLLVARFIPGLSTIAPPLAGAMRLALLSFVAYSGAGALLWIAVSLAIGRVFRSQIELAGQILERFGSFALAGLALAFVLFLAFKWWERRRFYNTLRMARITVDELRRLVNAGANPVILDVRSAAARKMDGRKIPGARPIDLETPEQHLQGVPKSSEIVIYCNCPSEASAARVARLLMDHGFKRVRPLAGGIDAWIAAGNAITDDRPEIAAQSFAGSAVDATAAAQSPGLSAARPMAIDDARVKDRAA
jgi:membrane protein DedA with SNARE-associated domain/rhodanese-related sulfurtransferase